MNEKVKDFTADQLRDIADAMDNSKLLGDCEDIESFIERICLN